MLRMCAIFRHNETAARRGEAVAEFALRRSDMTRALLRVVKDNDELNQRVENR